MKILVGVIYSIENEFKECLDKISQQTVDSEIVIVEKLPKKKAHTKLYKTFMERADDFDLFVKIDADMVLARDIFFKEVIDFFLENKQIDLLHIKVKDFYTDSLIWGLHVYSTRVKWDLDTKEELFTDLNKSIKLAYHDDNDLLAPAAYHCPNPSKFQSFHFGIHKGVKYLQWGIKEKNYSQSLVRRKNIQQTIENYNTTGDSRLGLAVLGAFFAISKKLDHKSVDFDNQEVNKFFDQIKDSSDSQIRKLIRSHMPFVFHILPIKLASEVHFVTSNRLSPFRYTVPRIIAKLGLAGKTSL